MGRASDLDHRPGQLRASIPVAVWFLGGAGRVTLVAWRADPGSATESRLATRSLAQYDVDVVIEVAMRGQRSSTAKQAVNIALNSDLVIRARAEGLDLSSIAEGAVASALERREREKFDAEIAQACRAHDEYLAEHGSLGEALRRHADGAE